MNAVGLACAPWGTLVAARRSTSGASGTLACRRTVYSTALLDDVIASMRDQQGMSDAGLVMSILLLLGGHPAFGQAPKTRPAAGAAAERKLRRRSLAGR
jgi:hypothetical protein